MRSFDDAAKTSGFVTLPAPLLEQILESQNLRVKDESGVFTALVRWVDAQPQQPPHDVTESLMKCVRFSLMSASFLEETVETSPLVRQHAFVVMQAHREALKEARTLRTYRRSQLRFEDLKVGMKVRVMDDLEYVKVECDALAPGANEAVTWIDEMQAYLGKAATIHSVHDAETWDEMRCAEIQLDDPNEVEDGDSSTFYLFPFHVLERV